MVCPEDAQSSPTGQQGHVRCDPIAANLHSGFPWSYLRSQLATRALARQSQCCRQLRGCVAHVAPLRLSHSTPTGPSSTR